jgi:hypothetical protein
MKKWSDFKISQGLMVSPSPAWADSSHPWTAGMYHTSQPVYDSDFKGRLCAHSEFKDPGLQRNLNALWYHNIDFSDCLHV